MNTNTEKICTKQVAWYLCASLMFSQTKHFDLQKLQTFHAQGSTDVYNCKYSIMKYIVYDFV